MDRWLRIGGLLAALLVGLAASPGARADAPPLIWRVCVTDVIVPPYLSGDPAHPGTLEKMLVDAGQQVGLSVLLLRFPVRRCGVLFDNHEVDATIAPADARGIVPMKNGAVDHSKRVARVNLIWVRRADTPYGWSGTRMTGVPAGRSLIVGTRTAFFPLDSQLQALGMSHDAAALSTHQALAKLVARRVDLVLALQEEAEYALRDPALVDLVVLPQAFETIEYFATAQAGLPPERQAQVEAWWSAMAKMRERLEQPVR